MHKLKDLCRTRWVERIDALDRFQTLHASIVACMESISIEGSSKWTPDTIPDASTLLLAISTTDFLSALVITNACLKYLLGLTRSLQTEAKDIVEAVAEINHIKSALHDVRENIDSYHSQWFASVEQMCASLGIQPSLPRLCGCQRHRSNVPAQEPSEYYCRTITVPILDHLLSDLDARFNKHQQTALYGLFLVPSVLATKELEEISPKVCELGDVYEVDLPHRGSLESDLHCWHAKSVFYSASRFVHLS